MASPGFVKRRIPTFWLALMLPGLPLLFFIATLCIGRYPVAIPDIGASIIQALTGRQTGISAETYAVVVLVRIPRAIQGVLVGASLAAAGVAFQGIFRNPLVSSSILGVSSGAGFGAALAILLFSSTLMSPLFAFIFGILAVGLSYLTGRISNTAPTITLVLGGTIVQSMFAALLSLTKYVADTSSQLPAITFWLMGSLASTKTSDIWLSAFPMLLGMACLMLMRWRINVLSMGDREARTLGLAVNGNKLFIIAAATLAAAGAVSVSGIVGWIGLVVPHIARMIVGNDHRRLLPVSMSIGACFLLAVDTICRTLTASEIPLGIVTALVGGPFFIYLLKKTKGENW